MQKIFIVSDAMEEMAGREVLPNEEFVVWDGTTVEPLKQIKGSDVHEVYFWLNRGAMVRSDLDQWCRFLLKFKRASAVFELVNEEDGIGFSPSQAQEMQMNEETFAGWSKTVLREHSLTEYREVEDQEQRTEFLEVHPVGAHAEWLRLGLVMNKNSPVLNESNVLKILEGVDRLSGVFWMDTFSGCPMATFDGKTKQWTDEDSLLLCIDIQTKLGLSNLKVAMVHSAVMAACARNRRHPVKEWIGGAAWDEVPRIKKFLVRYMGASDNSFNDAVSQNFLISMVARVYDPGCKVDNMMILEGGQGKRKSSALRALVGEWFVECNESLAGNHKDFLAVMHGKMLVEIAELDSFSKAETTKIKAIISTQSDRYRPPYGRLAETFYRTSVFVGTTNKEDYLEDSTGGRRFWPVAVAQTGIIDLAAITRDRDQLFAEALHEYKAGKSWWEVPEDQATQIQESRRRGDPWEQEIEDRLLCMDETTSHQVMDEFLKIEVSNQDARTLMRVANCLRALGWTRAVVRKGTKTFKLWKKVKTTPVVH